MTGALVAAAVRRWERVAVTVVTVREGSLAWRYELPTSEALRLAARMRAAGREVEVER
jgi:hypothetical protein